MKQIKTDKYEKKNILVILLKKKKDKYWKEKN